MSETRAVLFLATNERAPAWRQALLEAGLRLVEEGDFDAAEADVVLTDDAAAVVERAADALVVYLGEGEAFAHPRPEVVELPRDATPREVAIACALAGAIARERRAAREAADLRDRFRRLAERDPLTDLPNRRAWDEGVTRHLEAGATELCVAIFDLDHFKQVNDRLGHAAGDRALCDAAAAIRRAVRPGDLVARLGGDEFGLLLANIDAAAAAKVVERARAAVARAAELTASAGYAHSRNVANGGRDSLVAAADAALARAKAEGRDRSCGGGTAERAS